MLPKGKGKAEPATVCLVSGPTDGSAPIDLAPVVEAIRSGEATQHVAVADAVAALPNNTAVEVSNGYLRVSNNTAQSPVKVLRSAANQD